PVAKRQITAQRKLIWRLGAIIGAIVLGLADVGRCHALVQAIEFDRIPSDRPLDPANPAFANPDRPNPDRPLDPASPDLTAIAPVLLAQSSPNSAPIDPALIQLWDQGRQEYSAGR
ncbi:MAG: hypothetical protein ACO34J_12255, partial [Prochlorothrix sp.]